MFRRLKRNIYIKNSKQNRQFLQLVDAVEDVSNHDGYIGNPKQDVLISRGVNNTIKLWTWTSLQKEAVHVL